MTTDIYRFSNRPSRDIQCVNITGANAYFNNIYTNYSPITPSYLNNLISNNTGTNALNNNTSLLQQACSNASFITLPAGNFWINNTLTLSNNGIIFQGQGQLLTTLSLINNVNIPMIIITGGSSSAVSDIQIQNFSLFGNGYFTGTSGNTSGDSIYCWNAFNCLFQNLSITQAGSSSFHFDGNSSVKSSRNTVFQCNSYQPLSHHHNHDINSQDTVVLSCFNQQAGQVGMLLSGNGSKIINSHSFWSLGHNVLLNDFGGGNEIGGCILDRSSQNGLVVSGNTYNFIHDNGFFNEGQGGGGNGCIAIVDAGSGVRSVGNMIISNSCFDNTSTTTDGFTGANGLYYPSKTLTTPYGILINPNEQGNIVVGNSIDNTIPTRYNIQEPNNTVQDGTNDGAFCNNYGNQSRFYNNVALRSSNNGLLWNAYQTGSSFITFNTGSDYSGRLYMDATGTYHLQATNTQQGAGGNISFQDNFLFFNNGKMNITNSIYQLNGNDLGQVGQNWGNIYVNNIPATNNAIITNINTTNITGTNAFFNNLTFTTATGQIDYFTGSFSNYLTVNVITGNNIFASGINVSGYITGSSLNITNKSQFGNSIYQLNGNDIGQPGQNWGNIYVNNIPATTNAIITNITGTQIQCSNINVSNTITGATLNISGKSTFGNSIYQLNGASIGQPGQYWGSCYIGGGGNVNNNGGVQNQPLYITGGQTLNGQEYIVVITGSASGQTLTIPSSTGQQGFSYNIINNSTQPWSLVSSVSDNLPVSNIQSGQVLNISSDGMGTWNNTLNYKELIQSVSWTGVFSSSSTVKYIKNGNNVDARFLAVTLNTGPNATQFALTGTSIIPSGYRPPSNIVLPCITYNTGTTQFGAVQIGSNGQILVGPGAGIGTYFAGPLCSPFPYDFTCNWSLI